MALFQMAKNSMSNASLQQIQQVYEFRGETESSMCMCVRTIAILNVNEQRV